MQLGVMHHCIKCIFIIVQLHTPLSICSEVIVCVFIRICFIAITTNVLLDLTKYVPWLEQLHAIHHADQWKFYRLDVQGYKGPGKGEGVLNMAIITITRILQ